MRGNFPRFYEVKQIDDSIYALVPKAQASRNAALQARSACVMRLLYHDFVQNATPHFIDNSTMFIPTNSKKHEKKSSR